MIAEEKEALAVFEKALAPAAKVYKDERARLWAVYHKRMDEIDRQKELDSALGTDSKYS